MTGAPLPAGADAVVPFEETRDGGDVIRLTSPIPRHANFRRPGTDCRRHQIIVKAGQPMTPYDLARLATAGVEHLPAHAAPRVGFLCTGSELADDLASLRPGQLISGNRPLLRALLRQGGAEPVDLGAVPDTAEAISGALTDAQAQRLTLCITTGGMGPGKYDLVQHALGRLGGQVLYRSLNVRPGKATLAAMLDGLLVIALPGPPPAVHLLFHELIAPLIRQAQGNRHPLPKAIRATLAETVHVRQSGVLHLKEAVLYPRQRALFARLPRQGESPNAILLVPADRTALKAGESALLHPFSEI
jgi:molybdopterin molybdotransferase